MLKFLLILLPILGKFLYLHRKYFRITKIFKFMKYNCIYCLFDADSCDRKFFSCETLAFAYADKMGYKNFTVECIRYYYELD